MAKEFDLIIRDGRIADGTGGELFVGDVGVRNGRIAAVGRFEGQGWTEHDARGRVVTPGFVDIHTHYDAHVTWGSSMSPSSAHGVTTVVTGNCGVGFAPCKPEDRARLIRLMEGVEDIPEVVMTAGLPWAWESFADYMDFLDGREYDVDVAVQLPHAPLRVYVMGKRGADREPATVDDVAQMRALAAEAVAAGAVGFSTSRTLNHRASDGRHTPTICAARDELVGIAMGLADAGAGVLQAISDFDDEEDEFALMEAMVRSSGRPLSLSLMQMTAHPLRWRRVLDRIEVANEAGLPITAQVCGRPLGSLLGLELSFHPFSFCPSYREIAHLPLADRVVEMARAERKAWIISEFPTFSWEPISRRLDRFEDIYELGADPDYEPKPSASLAARAAGAGEPTVSYAYDRLLQAGGRAIFFMPTANYAGHSIAAAETMIRHPHALLGLGDGGAHSRIVCDASLPTYMLERWVKEPRGARGLELAQVVRALTFATALAVGLGDRGLVAPGYRADLNIIDMDAIRLHGPEVVHDLPGGGGRLHQRADGFLATFVAGEQTWDDARPTGALPGRLVRGARSLPDVPSGSIPSTS